MLKNFVLIKKYANAIHIKLKTAGKKGIFKKIIIKKWKNEHKTFVHKIDIVTLNKIP